MFNFIPINTQFCMKLIAILALFLLPFCLLAQDTMAAHYKIYSSSKQKVVTIDEIVDDLNIADILFFGEEHKDSTGHYLEHNKKKKQAEKKPRKKALSM